MIEPARLLFSPHTSDLEKQILASWTERPSDEVRAKTLAMLGVAGVLSVRRPFAIRV
jgi:hypothetical protein